jgi:hypothetical protein
MPLEGFQVLSGNGKHDLSDQLKFITESAEKRYGHIETAHHEWINTIDDQDYKAAIEKIRHSDVILSKLHEQFPNTTIKSVTEADEVYWAVSPKTAVGSDRSLVDCHYDAPFALFPTGGVIYYRVIIATNENDQVSTYFPGEKIRVKMSTGDFHGLDYNKDLHCVEGQIPPGKVRILLKLHYLIVPKGSESWEAYVRWINVKWTEVSRETMRMSAKPENPVEWCIGSFVNICRVLFNNIYSVLFVLVLLLGGLFFTFQKSIVKSRLFKNKFFK